MKGIILLIFFIGVLIPINVYGASARLIIDGHEITDLPAPPVLSNDRVLVPVREVFERVGGIIGWHSGHRQVTIFHGDDVLVLTIDHRRANLNGRFIEMDTAPLIINDRTMVPLRFPAEAFGFDVNWDSGTRSAIINSPGSTPAPNVPSGPGSAPPGSLPIIPLPPVDGGTVEYEPEPDPEKIETPWDDDDEPPPGITIMPEENPELARDVSASPIQTVPHAETSVTLLQTPRETGAAAFIITASSEISQVSHFLLPDNRLVVDIHNAVSNISGQFEPGDAVPVSEVRASQFSNVPRVTRVVFDIEGPAEFSLSLSADRRILTVSFSQNRITGVFTQSDNLSDTLFIQGDVLPSVRISTEGFPFYLTINIENASMQAASGLFSAGVFASHFETGQRPDGTAFIRVFVGAWPSFSLAHSTNSVALMLHHGISGLRYDSVNRELRIAREFDMDISQVRHIDEYLRFRYTLVLPPAAEVLGRGILSIYDNYINNVTISHDPLGSVLLTFYTHRVLIFSVHETETEYIIRAHLPREVHPFIVVIDPGHGGRQPGAIHNGIVEKDLVLDISRMVMQMLQNDPFIKAYSTRHDDSYVSLHRRAEIANSIGADLFISIHTNAFVNPDIHGIETWYTIGEKELSHNHSICSRRLSTIMQRHKINSTGANDRGLRNAPNFVVLRDTAMPSALLELGFISNPEEAVRLACIQHRHRLAAAIYHGIVEAFATHPPNR